VTGKRTAVEFFGRYKHKEVIPGEILEGTREIQASFLRGLFAADGHIERAGGMCAVALTCVNEVIIDQVMLMLLNFGIVCNKYRYESDPGSNNIYGLKGTVCYRIQFAGQFREIFTSEIGTYKEVPCTKVYHLDDETDVVVSINDAGECEVYDLTVDDETHSFIANGVAVSNCSEQPLLPNESCNLGSINLSKFCKDFGVDWEGLAEAVAIAVRFLDDVISVNKYPVSAIKKASLRTRKIGLGVMGWADLLLMLGIRYDSEEAVALAGKMMECIEFHALQASVNLAKERGSFPAFSDHYDDSFFDFFPDSTYPEAMWEELQEQIATHGLRNACVTTIAPTGSLSLIAGVSSGIEPNFQWEYTYHRVDTEFSERHSLAARYLDAGEKLAEHFVTALDIEPIWHIRMQAAWQLWLDSGISKTINLPYEASKKDVREAIREAWRRGCKGITLYRSGSRQQEVLVAKAQSQSKVSEKAEVISPRERPRMTSGSTMKIPVGDTCGTMFVTVNSDEVGPCESFVMLGRGGGCISSYAEALGRTISLALRSGVDPREIIDQLSGIRCSKVRWAEGGAIRSCPDAVAYALSSILGIGSFAKVNSNSEAGVFNPHEPTAFSPTIVSFGENPECPECGMMLSIEGRCLFCRACGYSKCG